MKHWSKEAVRMLPCRAVVSLPHQNCWLHVLYAQDATTTDVAGGNSLEGRQPFFELLFDLCFRSRLYALRTRRMIMMVMVALYLLRQRCWDTAWTGGTALNKPKWLSSSGPVPKGPSKQTVRECLCPALSCGSERVWMNGWQGFRHESPQNDVGTS